MLRDILTHTQAQLKSWLRQKNFEAKKLKPGERTTLLMETPSPYQNVEKGMAPRSYKTAGANVKDIKLLHKVEPQAAYNRDGTMGRVNVSTYLTAQDANGAYYLNLRDKVAQIRQLQKLLDDIAAELMSGYHGVEQVLPNGNGRTQFLAVGVAPSGAEQSARKARLGFEE